MVTDAIPNYTLRIIVAGRPMRRLVKIIILYLGIQCSWPKPNDAPATYYDELITEYIPLVITILLQCNDIIIDRNNRPYCCCYYSYYYCGQATQWYFIRGKEIKNRRHCPNNINYQIPIIIGERGQYENECIIITFIIRKREQQSRAI